MRILLTLSFIAILFVANGTAFSQGEPATAAGGFAAPPNSSDENRSVELPSPLLDRLEALEADDTPPEKFSGMRNMSAPAPRRDPARDLPEPTVNIPVLSEPAPNTPQPQPNMPAPTETDPIRDIPLPAVKTTPPAMRTMTPSPGRDELRQSYQADEGSGMPSLLGEIDIDVDRCRRVAAVFFDLNPNRQSRYAGFLIHCIETVMANE